jgi:NADH-quinone oxidoreductase subunit M
VTFVVASLASMGLPGFSGFVAELQVLIGAWQAFPILALLTGWALWWGWLTRVKVLQQAFFGEAQATLEGGRNGAAGVRRCRRSRFRSGWGRCC